MKNIDLNLITIEVGKESNTLVEAAFAELQVNWHFITVARSVVGKEQKGLKAILQPETLEEDALIMVSMPTLPDQTEEVAHFLIEQLSLSIPGVGSLVVTPVTSVVPEEDEEVEQRYRLTLPEASGKKSSSLLLTGVSQIVSIVQRGEGTNISTAALKLGQSVPSVTFGIGMGLREKLSLIRITFPRDKELMRLTVNNDEAQEVFSNLVDAAKLDQPGKGFIYLTPISKALPNTLLFRGSQRHAATMEQVIQALDSIQGGVGWRRKQVGESTHSGPARTYLKGMVEMTVRVQDGSGHPMVLAAMGAGAAGATISKSRIISRTENGKEAVGLEVLYLIVMGNAVDKITVALKEAGLFNPGLKGSIMMRPVIQALTYLGK